MATLTGNTIKDTYKSLLKVNDNGELAATLQELTDGLGNGSGISINTAGDLKATGILEFGSLKDTGEDITIAKFVDEADGIGNNDNDTSIPTSAAIVDYVAAQITLEDLDFSGDTGTGSVDLDSQVFAIQGTANEIETLGGGQTLTIGLVDSPTVSGTITGGSITDGTAILTGGTLTGNLTGTVTGTSILADGVTATTQATSDDSTKVATTAYVKSVLTLEDLDFAGDSGTGSVDLDSQSLTISGGTGLTSTASGQTLTLNIDSTVATLTGTQTLTNKTIDADNNTISNLEVDNLKAGVLDTDLNTVSASDDTVASAKAIKTYVDAQVTAQDLDFGADTGTGSVDLDSQSLTVTGGTGIDTTASGQDVSIAIDNTVATLTDAQELTNKTINADSNTVTNLEVDNLKAGVLDTDLTTVSASDDTLASAKSIKTYVDAQTTAQDLDITDGTTTSAVDLDSQTMAIQGTTNEVEVGLVDQTFTVGLPDDVVIAGDLTVNGTTTTVNTETLSVKDPLIEMANDNAANTVDTGFYANYSLDAGVTTKFAGLFKDASDSDTFKLFKGLEVEPTTTVDTAGTGYALADLDVAGLSASSGVISGDLTVDTNTLFVDSANNRVGIGQDNPSSLLEIASTNPAVTDVLSAPTRFRLTDKDTTQVFNQVTGTIEWYTNDATDSGVQSYISTISSNAGAGTMVFGTGAPSGLTERLRITGGGDVSFRDTSNNEAFYWDASTASLGIGTLNPSAPFHRFSLAVTTKHYDTNASTIIEGGESRVQICANDDGSNGGGIIISNATKHWGIQQTGVSDGNALEIGNYTSSATGIDVFGSMTPRMRIDSSGNVGIGAASPTVPLEVNGGTENIIAKFVSTDNNANIEFADNATSGQVFLGANGSDFRIGTSSTERMRITSGGEVLIGGTTDNGTYNLQVNGTGVWGAGAYVNGSDERLKEDIKPLESAINVVDKIKPVTYKYKESYSKDQSVQTGFIAQELLEVLDGQIYKDGIVKNDGEYMNVAYQNIIALLVKSTQELKAEIETLKSQINN